MPTNKKETCGREETDFEKCYVAVSLVVIVLRMKCVHGPVYWYTLFKRKCSYNYTGSVMSPILIVVGGVLQILLRVYNLLYFIYSSATDNKKDHRMRKVVLFVDTMT